MKRRCYNPAAPEYKYYGAKGVQVCEMWRNSFENFLEDMGPKPPKHPTKGHWGIDRIDPTKDYSPLNCRWLTASANTKRRNNTRKPKQ